MPPLVSAVPLTKAALVSTLQARAALASVSVFYSWPGGAMPNGDAPIEAIFLGATSGDSHIPAMKAGRKLRQEEFTLDVVIWVIQPGDAANLASSSEARAYVLYGELEGALADDPQLGIGTTLQWATVQSYTLDHAPAQKGWGTQIVAKIRCHARLA